MASSVFNLVKIPELKKRIFFTLLLLAVYRIGVHIPTPGIDTAALAALFEKNKGTLLGFFDLFSGGALQNLSIFTLGIMPYISASIILQLLTVVIPALEKLKKEGEAGRKKITQYTRYGTVVLSIIQGFGIAVGLEKMTSPSGGIIVLEPGLSFRFMTMLTLTSGTAFIMWLGEQITERGIGNGISLIIFAGIVARMPAAIYNTFKLMQTGEISFFIVLILVALMVVVIGCVIFMEQGQRRVPIQYAKRVVGTKMYGGDTTHLPIKVNSSGVIPPIFASSVILFPATIASFTGIVWLQTIAAYFTPGRIPHELFYAGFIMFFCYFYTAVTFNPDEVAENVKKWGGYIPGIRPGKKTAEYLDKILTRITFGGAWYLIVVCVLPSFLIAKFNVPFYFGGTALLIVVGVALDTVSQIESHLITRHYEGFMKKGKLKGRR